MWEERCNVSKLSGASVLKNSIQNTGYIPRLEHQRKAKKKCDELC